MRIRLSAASAYPYLLLVLVLAGCARDAPGAGATAPTAVAEETAVYAAVLQQLLAGQPERSAVVAAEPFGAYALGLSADQRAQQWAHLKSELPGLSDPVIAAYEASAAKPAPIRLAELQGRFDLIEEAALKQRTDEAGRVDWDGFYESHPESVGLVGLSPVGFGPDGSDALLSVLRRCHDLCGGLDYWFLTKQPGGAWAIVGTSTIMVF